MIKGTKRFRDRILEYLSEDIKLLLFDWGVKMKFILLNSSFKTLKDVNSNTHELVNSILDVENKKLIQKIDTGKDKKEGE